MNKILASMWIIDEKGEYVFETRSKTENGIVVKRETPEERGLKKSVSFDVVFYEKSEVFSKRHESKSKISWFKQKFSAKVKEGNDNIWIMLSDRRFFIKDIEPSHLGFTMLMPLESTENLLIEVEDETETTIEDVRAILKVTNYAFSDRSSEGFKKEVSA